MMKVLLMLISLSFMFKMVNYYLMQFFLQNLFFFFMFLFIVIFPLSNMMMWEKIYYKFGCDIYSMSLIMLGMWILSLMVMASLSHFYMNGNFMIYLNILICMLLFLIMCFMSMNLILFYLFFESSLIPVFMLIMGWGFYVDRIQAGFYMMLYTLFGSLPLFIMIFNLYNMNFTMVFNLIEINFVSSYFYFMVMMAFFIKMPMYFVHLWLPKAHVESPLVGSMVLAGIMLKLGSYGLMRFMLMMMNMCIKLNKFFIIISLMGGIYSSLICLCQVDMKMMVAYSSVVHMSVLMSGLMTLFNWGYLGGLMMMIAHGLCSSGLFCLVNLNYERLGSRSLLVNKGMINYFPSLSLMWFLLCSSNFSFPPSLNLFSEIILLSSLILWDKNLIVILLMILLLSASYSLYLYSFSQHGKFDSLSYFIGGVLFNEFMLLILHWVPLNLIFLIMFIYV